MDLLQQKAGPTFSGAEINKKGLIPVIRSVIKRDGRRVLYDQTKIASAILRAMEALREGTVPVITQGDLIGTSVFALCPESLYPARDSRALAERIDWWIEHPEERNRYAQRYADAARNYDINKSAEALIAMFRGALETGGR